jgi:thermitase
MAAAKKATTAKRSTKKRSAAKGSARKASRRAAGGPKLESRCDGFVIQVGLPGQKEDAALELAIQVAAETMRGKWDVSPLGPGADAFEVTRTRRDKSVALSTAWNYTYKLRAHRDVRTAEPSLTIPGHDLPEELVADFHTPEETLTAQSRLKKDEALPCAEEDHKWSLQLTRTLEAFNLPLPAGGKHRGQGIVIGHPDTGYTKHPQIWDGASRILEAKGFDFEDEDADATDRLVPGFLKQPGHGTATSSVIMSWEDPAGPEGVSGMAPRAKLIPIRVTQSVVLFKFTKLAKAIYHAVDKGAHVISMSLGGPLKSPTLERAVQYALSKGVVVFAAAGNVWPWVVYPARLREVIAVGACNCKDKPWKKTARGDAVDLSAPGESVWRAGIDVDEDEFTVGMGYGTSFAVATVAGACALWLAFHGRRNLVQRYGRENIAAVFKDLLVGNVRVPLGWKTDKDGAGILDTKWLLEAPLPATAPASGMGGFAPQAAGSSDELLSYFPEDDPARVMDATLALLNADHRTFGSVMAALGDEVLFHVATNPAFRSSIQQRARADTGFSRQAMRREAAKPRQAKFRAEASEALRARVGVG